MDYKPIVYKSAEEFNILLWFNVRRQTDLEKTLLCWFFLKQSCNLRINPEVVGMTVKMDSVFQIKKQKKLWMQNKINSTENISRLKRTIEN